MFKGQQRYGKTLNFNKADKFSRFYFLLFLYTHTLPHCSLSAELTCNPHRWIPESSMYIFHNVQKSEDLTYGLRNKHTT